MKSKEHTFAMILMTPDAQLRGRGMEGLSDNTYPSDTLSISNSLDRKDTQRELLKTVTEIL